MTNTVKASPSVITVLLLSFLTAGCAHTRPKTFQDPGSPSSSGNSAASAPLPGFADVSVPVSTAAIVDDNGITEHDISDLEEGEGTGAEVFISSAAPEPPAPVRLGGNGHLTITRQDTGEKISVTYRKKNGEYDKTALAQLNHVMRCSLDGSEKEMAVKLFELLDAVEDHFGKKGLVLLSGYRSYKLNHITLGAAEHSLHMLGWAADIRIPGYSSTKIKNFGRKLAVGGVGYYPSKGFTHLDVGRVRYWVVQRPPRRRHQARKSRVRPSAKTKKSSSSKASARKKARN